jgi:hypothetical protein
MIFTMEAVKNVYEIRPRKDHRGVDLISDELVAIRLYQFVGFIQFLLQRSFGFVRFLGLVRSKRYHCQNNQRDDPRDHRPGLRFMPAAMRAVSRRAAHFLFAFWTSRERHAGHCVKMQTACQDNTRARGRFQRVVSVIARETKSRHAVKHDSSWLRLFDSFSDYSRRFAVPVY